MFTLAKVLIAPAIQATYSSKIMIAPIKPSSPLFGALLERPLPVPPKDFIFLM
jgi:hypothetical protein